MRAKSVLLGWTVGALPGAAILALGWAIFGNEEPMLTIGVAGIAAILVGGAIGVLVSGSDQRMARFAQVVGAVVGGLAGYTLGRALGNPALAGLTAVVGGLVGWWAATRMRRPSLLG